jgi:hypothetical protein
VTLTVDLTDGFEMGSIAVELKDKLTQPFLFANVHQSSSGSVTGSGVGSRLFGTDTKSRLRSGGDRNLQADEVAGASEFELDFTIAKADNVQGNSGASGIGAMTMAVLAVACVLAGLF